ncbi:hypothetical protein, partial [Flagellimonas sp.]
KRNHRNTQIESIFLVAHFHPPHYAHFGPPRVAHFNPPKVVYYARFLQYVSVIQIFLFSNNVFATGIQDL